MDGLWKPLAASDSLTCGCTCPSRSGMSCQGAVCVGVQLRDAVTRYAARARRTPRGMQDAGGRTRGKHHNAAHLSSMRHTRAGVTLRRCARAHPPARRPGVASREGRPGSGAAQHAHTGRRRTQRSGSTTQRSPSPQTRATAGRGAPTERALHPSSCRPAPDQAAEPESPSHHVQGTANRR